MLAVLFNAAAVLAGGLIGTVFGNRIPEKYTKVIMVAMALVTFGIGIQSVLQTQNRMLVVTKASENGPCPIFVPESLFLTRSAAPLIRSSSFSAVPRIVPTTMQRTTIRIFFVCMKVSSRQPEVNQASVT